MNALRRFLPSLAAVGSLLTIYAMARLPEPPEDRAKLAKRFRFESETLPQVTRSTRTIRTVRPSLASIAAWISAVGAAVALHDLDGDGLSNDVLLVDVRSDEVVVAPVPGTGSRYAPFDLLRARGCGAVSATAPMGVVPADVNEDGLADALVYFWGRSPLLFLRRDGAALTPEGFDCREIIEPSEEWYTNAATFADVDGDGHADLVVGNYFREGSGVLDPSSRSREMQMQDSMSLALNGGVNRILLWTPGGFRDARGALTEDIARGWTLAIGAQDLDGDLLPELYFANDFGPDRLLRNRSTPGHLRFELVEGRRRFLDPKSKVLGHDSFKGMGVDFADINNDAIPDVFVSNITDVFALEESNLLFVSANGTWHDESERLGVSRSGWAWDARFGDFDNDGSMEMVQATGFIRGTVNRWPELHELAMANDTLVRRERNWPDVVSGDDLSGTNTNPFFTRASDGRWYDVAAELGIPPAMVSRGIATADVDDDGRLDFAVANQWQTSRFFHNASDRTGVALVLHLRLGTETRVIAGPPAGIRGSPAIGAAVRVRLPRRTLVAQVDGGNGHSGKRASELHFGIGNEKDGDVEIAWRDRRGRVARQRFHLTSGTWTIVLDDGKA